MYTKLQDRMTQRNMLGTAAYEEDGGKMKVSTSAQTLTRSSGPMILPWEDLVNLMRMIDG